MRRKKILCTRPVDGAEDFKTVLELSGMDVIVVPMIEIYPVKDLEILDSKLDNLNNYDGIIFTSSNGVKLFFKRVKERGITPSINIYAVGEKTRQTIEDFGYSVSVIPESFDSKSLAKLLSETGADNSSYLFPSGNLSMKGIVKGLKNVDEVIVYETHKPLRNQLTDKLEQMLNNNEIDCFAFFSGSAVKNFAELFPNYKNYKAVIAVIGNTTKKRVEEIGLKAKIIAKKATAVSLAEEIINYYDAG